MNNIREIVISSLFLWCVVVFLMFLLFSFAQWNFDPSAWGQPIRSVFSVFSAFALAICVAVVYIRRMP